MLIHADRLLDETNVEHHALTALRAAKATGSLHGDEAC